MKRNKLILSLGIGLLLTVLVIELALGRRRAGQMAVGLSFVGFTNVNGAAMAWFKVHNHQSRRIWLRHADYLLGEAFQEPRGAWHCSMNQAISNRWGKAPPEPMVPQQYLPAEPTPTSPDPTDLVVPVPTNQPLWRIGLTVEFNISLPHRLRFAWKTRDAKMLKLFINNSAEALWVESPVITNRSASAPLPQGSR